MTPQHYDSNGARRHGALLFGDDCLGIEAALAAIEQAGLSCRIVDRMESAHLGLQGALADLLVLEAASTDEDELVDLLTRIVPYARETGTPIIATGSSATIDVLWSHLPPGDAQLLCQPTEFDRRAAIDMALAQFPSRVLQDSATARDRQLQGLRDDVERIAKSVRVLVGDTLGEAALSSADRSDAAVNADDVRCVIRERRLRDRFFDNRLFADPAWDILLDLYAAYLERREVSISSLCIAAATPPTTALRWITSMIDAALLTRRPDDHDKRRHLVTLSQTALDAIERYFVALKATRTAQDRGIDGQDR